MKLFTFEIEKIKTCNYALRIIEYERAHITVDAEDESEARRKVEFFLQHEPHVRIRLLK